MTSSSFKNPTAFLLLDIEGTTTPIDFVYKVLFPYARSHVREFLAAHQSSPDIQSDIAGLIEQNSEDVQRGLDPPLIRRPPEQASVDEVVAYFHWLMDSDRKVTPLKSIQGKIWERGYEKGELHSQVFEDVPPAFKRWQEQGKRICIYSSGSVLAQKLLFANTEAGDLTNFINAYFDTNIGEKKDPESYRRIATSLETQTSQILFLSDVTAELNAAATVGMPTTLCVRPGNHPQPDAATHPLINSFAEILA